VIEYAIDERETCRCKRLPLGRFQVQRVSARKRTRRPAVAAAAKAGSSSRHRGALWLGGALVGALVLGTVYFWPQHEGAELPPQASAEPALVLPAEPEERTVEQLKEEAELAVAELLKRYPQSPAAHKAAATLYQFLNQFERVTEHWEKCIALDPTDAAAYEWLAKVQLRQGNDEAAARTLDSARKAGKRTAELVLQAAIVEQRRGDLGESEKIARTGLGEFPEHCELWIALGQAQLQRGEFAQARDSFESALRVDPKSAAARFGLSNACLRLGDEEAAEMHRRQLEEMQSAHRAHELTFEKNYEQSLRLAVATVLSSAATLHNEEGNSREAERLCQRAYAIHPGYPDSYRQLANMYHRDGKIGRAIVMQQRLAQIEPESDDNHLNLASLLFQAGRMEEGEAVLLSASRSAPRKAIFPSTLAVVYFRSEQVSRARQFAEHAISLEPTPERYRLLAEICRQQADLTAADAALAAASELTSRTRP
jgi:tetratricopeptide (TPR) repeat protein